MTNCLILGGSGFIGSHLARALLKKDYSVRIFGDFKSGKKNIELLEDRIEIIKGDFRNSAEVASAVRDMDHIFHYISTTNPTSSYNNPIYDIETNIICSVRLMEIALEAGVEKIIFPSTGGTIYGNARTLPIAEEEPADPQNPYAISKLTIEKYLQYFFSRYGLNYVALRYSNPYGEGQNPLGNQGVIPIFLNKILNDEAPVIYGDGNSVRDYIYINDSIEATIALFESKSREKVFNIGSGTGTTLNQLIDIMSEITGKSVSPDYRNDEGRYVRNVILDISRIQKYTGWQPKTSISEGIGRTYEWLKQTDKKIKKR